MLFDNGTVEISEFQTIGYYILSIEKSPFFLTEYTDKIISVSPCIGEQHPCLKYSVFIRSEIEESEYIEKVGLSADKYKKLKNECLKLFEKSQIDIDGRFLNKSDMLYFYNEYFKKENYLSVSLSINPIYLEKLEEEFIDVGSTATPVITKLPDNNDLLGYDIIGWDITGFHSFLCNGLQEEINNICFNLLGLISNKYSDVELFSEQIQDKGEPIPWFPCRLGLVTHQ